MNCNKKLYLKENTLTNKKRSNTEITKSNSSFKTNNFKVSRITAKLYEKESGKIVKKDKIISTYERSSVKNQEHKICNITNNERILASSNTNSYKNMISQDLSNEKNLQGKKYIPSKNELIKNSKFGKLSNNHLFTVEACFEHTLIHIIKSEYLDEKDIKTILDCHPLLNIYIIC